MNDDFVCNREAVNLCGGDALAFARLVEGTRLDKYNDPIEDARTGLTLEEAEEIAQEDAGLLHITINLEKRALAADSNDCGWYVEDQRGVTWWPSDEVQDELEQADDPEALILALVVTDPVGAGEWVA